MNQQSQELLLDLLIKKAVYGLTEDEQKQLHSLEATTAEKGDLSFEMAAARINLAGADANEKLPAHIRARIEDAADDYFRSRETDGQAALLQPAAALLPKTNFWNWLGWAVAAAACIVLAINIYTTRFQPPPDRGGLQTPTPAPEKLTPVQERQKLIDNSTDLTKANWGAGNVKEIASVSGDVVWSDAKQAGYMRFRGLPVNDKGKNTYQLWIFDETQDEKTPIDGGTFDIDENGEVVIPINANLKAKNPKLFAVTIEKPGGVMVSDRKRIAALGKLETKPDSKT